MSSAKDAAMEPGLVVDRPGVTAQGAVDKLVREGLLDELMGQVDAGDLR